MNRQQLYHHKIRNLLQTATLLLILAALLSALAWIIGGPTLMLMALLAVTFLYLLSPAGSPRMVQSLYRGRLLAPQEAPRLYALVEKLARRAGLSHRPMLYYIPSQVMNAFATGGQDNAMIAITDAMLRRLEMRELAGVLAHEISHIANEDLRVMAFADLVSRITNLLSLVGQILLLISMPLALVSDLQVPWLAILLLLLAPTLSALGQLALSRNREFEADRRAAELAGDPLGLASALGKLENLQRQRWERILLPQRRLPEPSLLRTHPPTEERIQRLLELAQQPQTDIPQILVHNTLHPHDFLDAQLPYPRNHWWGQWY